MASKSYTLLEYLVTIEMELKKLKKIVAESVGADYSELIAQITSIGQELNSFKSSITNTVDSNNSEITSKFNSLEQQFNTFKTSITNTVNTNKSEITSQVSSLNTQFSQFKTTLESQVSGLTTRVTSVENRVSSLENNGGSSGGSVDLTEVNNRISTAEGNITTLQSDVTSLKGRVTTLENIGGSSGGSSGEADGYGEKLIAHYIHKGNKEIQFTEFNFKTCEGTTSKPHGLTSATEVMIVPNGWVMKNRNSTTVCVPIEWTQYGASLKLVPIDDTTLRLTKTDGTTIIPVDTSRIGNTQVNISKFHFEIPVAWSISNIQIPTNHIRIVMKGYIKGMTNRYFKWKTTDNDGNVYDQPYFPLYEAPKPTTSNAVNCVFAYMNFDLDFIDGLAKLECDNIIEGRADGSQYLVWYSTRERDLKLLNKINSGTDWLSWFGSHSSTYALNSNGTHVYIYALGGV